MIVSSPWSLLLVLKHFALIGAESDIGRLALRAFYVWAIIKLSRDVFSSKCC